MQRGNDKGRYSFNFLLKVGKRSFQGHTVHKLAKIYDIGPGTVSKARAAWRGYRKGFDDAQELDQTLFRQGKR